MNVLVCQCPCGAAPRTRTPQSPQPKRRTIAVSSPVSSLNTRQTGRIECRLQLLPGVALQAIPEAGEVNLHPPALPAVPSGRYRASPPIAPAASRHAQGRAGAGVPRHGAWFPACRAHVHAAATYSQTKGLRRSAAPPGQWSALIAGFDHSLP